jgi:hypothetical protein
MPREHTMVRTGNHLRITMDGQTVGLMQSIDCSDDYGVEPQSGIGDIHVKEYVPTVARHTLQTNFAVLKNELLVEKGFVPGNGDDALRGLVFDVEIFDTREGKLVKKYRNCTYASGSAQFQAHRTIMRNATFMALDTEGDM